MISVLYFIRKIIAEYINNKNSIKNNGMSILECIVELPKNLMLDGWCNVFHQSTEYLMIGKFIIPRTEIINAALFVKSLFLYNLNTKINPKYKIIKKIIDVSLASQAQKDPQVGFPHTDPVIIAKQVNKSPIGAKQ